MRPILYDFLRALISPGVLLMVVLTTLLAVVLLALILPNVAPPNGYTGDSATNFGIDIVGGIFGFFVPVLGLIAGNSIYAKDRATGILESVLCRPVTKGALIFSRYVATVLSCAFAIAIALTVTDVVVALETTFFLSPFQLVPLYLSLVVEAASFGGFVILLSHLFRSTSIIQGASTVVFAIFSFIWYIVMVILLVEVKSAPQTMIFADYFNPAQYSTLVTIYVQHTFLFGFLTNVEPAAFGLTLAGLLVSGIVWSILPFALAYHLATTRD